MPLECNNDSHKKSHKNAPLERGKRTGGERRERERATLGRCHLCLDFYNICISHSLPFPIGTRVPLLRVGILLCELPNSV